MAQQPHGLSRMDRLNKACLAGEGPAAAPIAQVFGRLKPANPVQIKNITHDDVIDALDKLTDTMEATTQEDGPADAGMTFLGQFIDHDITLDATSALGRRIDPATIRNVRTPGLDLDCVYGDGPEASPHLYGGGEADHFLMFGREENHLDLARTCAGKALIGDPRNDENILVAQTHGIFIALHNLLMSKYLDDPETRAMIQGCAMEGIEKHVWEDQVPSKSEAFEAVRRFLRLHYQWVVWNEFLPDFCDQACLDRAMRHHLFGADIPAMPVEFSGAAYRFGHATTQFEYKMNDTWGTQGLFELRGFGRRPELGNVTLDWFFGPNAQKARPVAPKLGAPLFKLPFVTSGMTLDSANGAALSPGQAAKLALRNMVRDRYTYQLASGQHFADHLSLDPVPVPPELKAKGFTKTPLWFYILQEAEVHGDGKLTGVGGSITAAVFANLLKRDPTTYIHIPHFKPWDVFSGSDGRVFTGMVEWLEANRDHTKYQKEVRCG